MSRSIEVAVISVLSGTPSAMAEGLGDTTKFVSLRLSICASGSWSESSLVNRSSTSVLHSSTSTVSKVGEPGIPPPLTSPLSDGGDVKTLVVLETELVRDGAWDLAFRGLPVGGLRAADRLVLTDPPALDWGDEGRSGDIIEDLEELLCVEFFNTSDRRLEAVEALLVGAVEGAVT